MRFVVTCLDDDFQTRVLASSKIFDTIASAIKYGNSVANERIPTVVPTNSSSRGAAEFIFDHVVEKHPHFVSGSVEEFKSAIRHDVCDDLAVVFAPGNEMSTAFHKDDMEEFMDEIDCLMEELQC